MQLLGSAAPDRTQRSRAQAIDVVIVGAGSGGLFDELVGVRRASLMGVTSRSKAAISSFNPAPAFCSRSIEARAMARSIGRGPASQAHARRAVDQDDDQAIARNRARLLGQEERAGEQQGDQGDAGQSGGRAGGSASASASSWNCRAGRP